MNVVVTGASRGIGFELVKRYSREGHNVLAISRNEDRLSLLQKMCENDSYAGPVDILALDLTQSDLSPIDHWVDKIGKTDILVNNAGALVHKPFSELTENDFETMFATNVKAVFRLLKFILKSMNTSSHVVNIGSMGGFQGSVKFSGLSLYSSSKGALAILTECLAEEYKDSGIRFNCLALGSAQTQMLEEAFPGYKAPVSAEDMSRFIYDFSLNGNTFFNGKVLPVAVTTP